MHETAFRSRIPAVGERFERDLRSEIESECAKITSRLQVNTRQREAHGSAREFFILSNAIRRPSGRAPDFRAFRRISGRFALIFTAFRLEVSGVSPGNPAIRHDNPPVACQSAPSDPPGNCLAIWRNACPGKRNAEAPRRNAGTGRRSAGFFWRSAVLSGVSPETSRRFAWKFRRIARNTGD